MSLPAWQQRALERIEGALQASEPHLASMFAIFARLNANEPVSEEPLVRPLRRRRRWSSAGTAAYAAVLIPVMFVMVVVGAVVGGNARSATTCDVGYSVVGNSPLIVRPSCQATGKTTSSKTTSGSRAIPCARTALAARPAIWTGGELGFSPPESAAAGAGDTPGMCHKLPRDGGSVADRAPGT